MWTTAAHSSRGSCASVMDCLSSGRINEAVEAFQRGLAAAAPGDSRLGAPSEVMSELHLKLGRLACFAAISNSRVKLQSRASAGDRLLVQPRQHFLEVITARGSDSLYLRSLTLSPTL